MYIYIYIKRERDRERECCGLRNVSTSGTNLPDDLGVAKTTPARTKPPKRGGVFALVGWNSKYSIIAMNLKWLFIYTLAQELKWLQIQRVILGVYTFMAVSSIQRPTVVDWVVISIYVKVEYLESWMQQCQVGPDCLNNNNTNTQILSKLFYYSI